MQNNRKRNLVIAVAGLIVLIVVSLLLYIFAWRPSDNDYDDANKQLSDMKIAAAATTNSLNLIQYFPNIDDTSVTNFGKVANLYNDSFKSLAKNPAILRDSKIKAVYDQNTGAFTEYGQSLNDFVKSIMQYRSLINTCSELILSVPKISTTAQFDTTAKDCNNAISSAKSTSSSAFGSQVAGVYAPLFSNLVASYRKNIAAAADGARTISLDEVNAVKKELSALTTKPIALSITPNIIDSLANVSTSLTSQKSQFFR